MIFNPRTSRFGPSQKCRNGMFSWLLTPGKVYALIGRLAYSASDLVSTLCFHFAAGDRHISFFTLLVFGFGVLEPEMPELGVLGEDGEGGEARQHRAMVAVAETLAEEIHLGEAGHGAEEEIG